MARMVKRLSKLDIDEISLVDKPANQHGLVAIAKRDEESTMSAQPLFDTEGYQVDPSELEPGEYVYDEAGNEYVNVVEDELDEYDGQEGYDDGDEVGKAVGDAARLRGMYAADGARRAAARGRSAAESGGRRAAGAVRNLPRREQEGFNRARRRSAWRSSSAFATGGQTGRGRLGTAADNARDKAWDVASNRRVRYGAYGAGVAGTGAAGYEGQRRVRKSYGESVLEELSKSYGDDDRDMVVSKAIDDLAYENQMLVSKAEEAEQAILDMQAEREYGEFYEVAKGYGYAGDEAEEVADLLYDTALNSPEQLPMLDRVLTSQSTIAKSVLGEQGFAGGHESDALAQVYALADEAVSKTDGAVTSEQAITELFSANPGLYDEYESDNRY